MPVRGPRRRRPAGRALRLVLAATAGWTFGLVGVATGVRGDSWPVGSIVPKAEMVPWGAALTEEPSPAPPRPRGPAPPSPFSMDDGYVAPPRAGGGDDAQVYGALDGEAFPVPAVALDGIDPDFLRATVPYATSEPPGTIVVDPAAHYLYLVLEGGQAIRYGVGVGREGFGWSGRATVRLKRVWPDWHPPRAMIERQPELRRLLTSLPSGTGMAGGPDNPLGARALYLFEGGRDTLYRIHGTTEPASIGKSVSSGCIRMLNQDVIDLYDRVPTGATVVVLGAG